MAEQLRKSTKLNLRFPYDWSNPSISDEALILNVLNRGLFADICRICAYFGIDAVRDVASSARQSAIAKKSLTRMMNNIEKGFCDAQSQQTS